MGQHVQKISYMYATIDHRDHILGLLFIQERKRFGKLHAYHPSGVFVSW